jgi:thioredoxin-like negative regulator of GroEL
MKTKMIAVFLCSVLLSLSSLAEIKRVSEGGVDLTLTELNPNNDPAVVVFHTPWDQTSISLLEEIESWSEQYSDLLIIFVDVVDARTQVYQQFSLEKIPSIIVFDRDQNKVGSTIDSLSDLEELLSDEDII